MGRVRLGLLFLAATSGAAAIALGTQDSVEVRFQEQLRLARSEGIPTTAAEFAATIPPVKTNENAAPLYRKLEEVGLSPAKTSFYLSSNPGALVSDRYYLDANTDALRLIDLAVRKPHCVFDRNWSDGLLLALPEYRFMKSAARVLILRGCYEAGKRNARAAISDFKKTLVIAAHVREDPTLVSYLVSLGIAFQSYDALAAWSLEYRNEPLYRDTLKRYANAVPPPSLRRAYSGQLYVMLNAVDHLNSAAGLRSVGLIDSDIPPESEIEAIRRKGAGKTKADIVQGFREAWAAFKLPASQQSALISKADSTMETALMAYPYAYLAYKTGSDPIWSNLQEMLWITASQRCNALVRALCGPSVKWSIDTSDLRSPFDGKQLRYSFDGRQITMVLSPESPNASPNVIHIPPDAAINYR